MGSSPTLSIASVNVNGIRAAKRNGMEPWIAERAADIVTMQEVRATDDIFVEHVDTMFGADWHRVHAESEAKGRAGVAVVSHLPINAQRIDIGGKHSRYDRS